MSSTPPTARSFSVWRLLRLSTFQIGSAMGDILVTSIWNRIMIVNLGMPAWLVGLLIALRYLLTPLSLWAGFSSDTRPLFGLRRTPYIWLGRGLMALSLPLLGLSVSRFTADRADALGWAVALAFFVLYGTGSLMSGSPFLALVRDSVPKERQGLAVSLMETALILLFPIVAIAFSVAMREFDVATFWRLVTVTAGVGGFFWLFSLLGIERRGAAAEPTVTTPQPSFGFVATFRDIWGDARIRHFFTFLALATFAAWAQDAILEPFGAEVIGQSLGQTTRYSAYWQGATALVLIAALVLGRRRRPEQQRRLTQVGLSIMGAGMALLSVAAVTQQARLVTVALVLFGAGFGVYTFGGLSLMVVMTSDRQAGAYLGLWTITILLSRGLGISLGGALRDGLLAAGLSPALSYGLIFLLEAVGLVAAVLALARVNVLSFARDSGRVSTTDLQVASADI